jgi:hypothetical protein
VAMPFLAQAEQLAMPQAKQAAAAVVVEVVA